MDNPYEAPTVGESLRPEPVGGDELDVRTILTRTWQLFRQQPFTVLATVAIYITVVVTVNAAYELLSPVDETFPLTASALALEVSLQIMCLVVPMSFYLGTMRTLLDVACGSNPSDIVVLGDGHLLLGAVIASVVVAVLTVIGLLLLVVPGIILLLGWSVTMCALVDQRLGGVESLYESWRLTKDHRVRLLGIYCTMGLLATVATLLTCGLGVLVVLPILFLGQVVIYTSLLESKGPRPRATDDPEHVLDGR